MYIIFVEGNIGSGKSTVVDAIERRLLSFYHKKVKAFPEPVDEWTSSGLLQAYYKEPEKYAFSLQLAALAARMFSVMKAMQQKDELDFVIFERSIWSDHIFFELNKQYFTKEQIDIYEKQYFKIEKELESLKSIFIFVQAPIEKLVMNILQRSRPTEELIDRFYLEHLQAKHETLIEDILKRAKDHPCLLYRVVQYVESDYLSLIENAQCSTELMMEMLQLLK